RQVLRYTLLNPHPQAHRALMESLLWNRGLSIGPPSPMNVTRAHYPPVNLTVLGIVTVLLVFVGCTFPTRIPTEHVVMFDSDGSPVDPTGNIGERRHSNLLPYPKMPEVDYSRYLDVLFEQIQQRPHAAGTRRVLLFVHGGLNTQVSSLERVITPVEDDTPLFQ